MNKGAERLKYIEEYYFSKKLREVKDLINNGAPIINMGIGSPDLDPPVSVVNSIKESLKHKNAHQYQSYKGINDLRLEISNFYSRFYNIKLNAEGLAIEVAKKLEIIGILAVEMFLTSENEILVNEVAPRPHNSYHFSIEGSYTSQFEQLLRSILDMPLGSTKIIEAAVMVNLVGEKGSNGPVIYKNFDQIIGLEGVNPHIYGKFETRFNRKMGHVTVINENIDKAKELAKEIKETIIITSEK